MSVDIDRVTDRLFLRRERKLGAGPWDDGGAEYLSYFRSGFAWNGLCLAIALQRLAHVLRNEARRARSRIIRKLAAAV